MAKQVPPNDMTAGEQSAQDGSKDKWKTPAISEAATSAALVSKSFERKTNQSDSKATIYMFPSDLGQSHISDYVSFYFLDIISKDGKWVNEDIRKNSADIGSDANPMGTTTLGKINNVSKTISGLAKGAEGMLNTMTPVSSSNVKSMVSQAESAVTSFIGVADTYKQTGDVIGLMMPASIEYNSGAGWLAVNAAPTQIGMLAQILLGDASFKDVAGQDIAGLVGNILMENGQQAIESMTKKVFNPYVSQAFEAMQRRQFRFEWTLTPKNQKELNDVKQIIWLFRYHMHPSLDPTHTFLRYPSQVDIKYQTNSGDDNTWLPRIATCVIKDFSSNYTPNGQWATSDADMPGAPYQFHISVTVEEIVPLVKQDIVDGY